MGGAKCTPYIFSYQLTPNHPEVEVTHHRMDGDSKAHVELA